MRKTSLLFLLESIFFFILAIAPFVAYFFVYFGTGASLPDIGSFFTTFGIKFQDTVIFDALWGIFGEGGILPLVVESSALYPICWLLVVTLLRVFLDVLLFIPNLCLKLIHSSRGF